MNGTGQGGDLLKLEGRLSPQMIRAAQTIFDDWWEQYEGAIYDNGSRGQPEMLFAALWESWKNFR
jgi:hypothetical protein